MNAYFKKHIALPQDHGSWVFVISPLLIGMFAGGTFSFSTFILVVAVMAAFLLRQPLTIAVKSYAGRRPKSDLPAARFWVLIYGTIASLALLGLVLQGFGSVLYLAAPGVPVFAWHLWLVRRRDERKQVGVEVIATGVLALAAPAAFWVTIGGYDPGGWWLWALTWLQSGASISYTYLRLEQREQAKDMARSESKGSERSDLWRTGPRAFLYTSFNLAVSLFLGWAKIVPQLIFMPFLIQWLETLWGTAHPAIGWKPTRIGIRQLVVSSSWTVLFILFWRVP